MQLSNQQAERLVGEALDAIQAGRPDDARRRLDAVTATGQANARVWLLLATVCRGQKDMAAEEAALDKVLEMEPRATADFDWVPAVEAATDVIRQELLAAMETGIGDFMPYLRPQPNQPRTHPLFNKSDWSALFFAENGRLLDETIERCPGTCKAVQSAPLPWIDGWEPTVMFSLLKAGTRIPEHTGTHNTRHGGRIGS